jgi:hypothetical protein
VTGGSSPVSRRAATSDPTVPTDAPPTSRRAGTADPTAAPSTPRRAGTADPTPPPARRRAATADPMAPIGSGPTARMGAGGVLAAGSGPAPASSAGGPAGSQRLSSPSIDVILPPLRIPRGAISVGPYTVAAIPAGRRVPNDLFAPRHLPELGKVIEQVLAAEAPMHVDLLARRVGAYFGIGRITQRVAEQIRHAIEGRGRWGDEHDFVWRMDQDPAGVSPVRVASGGPSALREIDEVPLTEIAAAIRIVVERAFGIGPRELVRDAARLLGFSRITDRVTERIGDGLRLAQRRELVRLDGTRVTLPPD